jgi:hypothetical protein
MKLQPLVPRRLLSAQIAKATGKLRQKKAKRAA